MDEEKLIFLVILILLGVRSGIFVILLAFTRKNMSEFSLDIVLTSLVITVPLLLYLPDRRCC